MDRTACTEPQCLYKGALYLYLTVELNLYSPYGPYGLYRASVPVQGCTLPYSRAIPLLPLWAVQPVKSLSTCTRVHLFDLSSDILKATTIIETVNKQPKNNVINHNYYYFMFFQHTSFTHLFYAKFISSIRDMTRNLISVKLFPTPYF
jgi:hypothetical protein